MHILQLQQCLQRVQHIRTCTPSATRTRCVAHMCPRGCQGTAQRIHCGFCCGRCAASRSSAQGSNLKAHGTTSHHTERRAPNMCWLQTSCKALWHMESLVHVAGVGRAQLSRNTCWSIANFQRLQCAVHSCAHAVSKTSWANVTPPPPPPPPPPRPPPWAAARPLQDSKATAALPTIERIL